MTKLQHPAVGQTYPAGKIISVLRPRGAGRHLVAKFSCSTCGKTDTARLTVVRSGKVRSCGCGSKQAYLRFLELRATRFSAAHPKKAEAVWEQAEEHGLDKAAKESGLDRPLCSAIYRKIRAQKAKSVVPEFGQTIHDISQNFGYSSASRILGIVRPLVMVVTRKVYKSHKSAMLAIRQTQSKIHDAMEVAAGALIALRSPELWRPRRGEFTKGELPPPSKAKNSLIAQAYQLLRTASVPDTIAPIADRFLSAVERTRQKRQQRSARVRDRLRLQYLDRIASAA